MSRIDQLRIQFTYEFWANRKILNAIHLSENNSQASLEMMMHIFIVLDDCLKILTGLAMNKDAEWKKEHSIKNCLAVLNQLEQDWIRFLEDDSYNVDDYRSYTDSYGNIQKVQISLALTSLPFHGAHHRGQIALQMKKDNIPPVDVDYYWFHLEHFKNV